MIDEVELSKRIIFFRAIKKLSITSLAKQLDISINTLQKMIRKEHVKETTKIYTWKKLDVLEKGGN